MVCCFRTENGFTFTISTRIQQESSMDYLHSIFCGANLPCVKIHITCMNLHILLFLQFQKIHQTKFSMFSYYLQLDISFLKPFICEELYLLFSQFGRNILFIREFFHNKTILHLRKTKCVLVGGGSQERQTLLLQIYDKLIIPLRFSFVLSFFQYHNALLETQMRYRLLNCFLKWFVQRKKYFIFSHNVTVTNMGGREI